jgi:hypothetical protein
MPSDKNGFLWKPLPYPVPARGRRPGVRPPPGTRTKQGTHAARVPRDGPSSTPSKLRFQTYQGGPERSELRQNPVSQHRNPRFCSRMSPVPQDRVAERRLPLPRRGTLPLPVAVEPSPDNITLVRGGCGWGFHREYGHCVRNGTAYVPPVVVVPHYVPPVVVAPHVAPNVVVAPTVCPHGCYLDPSGQCVPY